MNAYRKIKFTTPVQLAAQALGLISMYFGFLGMIIFFN